MLPEHLCTVTVHGYNKQRTHEASVPAPLPPSGWSASLVPNQTGSGPAVELQGSLLCRPPWLQLSHSLFLGGWGRTLGLLAELSPHLPTSYTFWWPRVGGSELASPLPLDSLLSWAQLTRDRVKLCLHASHIWGDAFSRRLHTLKTEFGPFSNFIFLKIPPFI